MDLTRYRHLHLRRDYPAGQAPAGYGSANGIWTLDLPGLRHALLLGAELTTTDRSLGTWNVDLGFCARAGINQDEPWWGRLDRIAINASLPSRGIWYTPPLIIPIVDGQMAALYADGPSPSTDGMKSILWHLLIPPPEGRCGDA